MIELPDNATLIDIFHNITSTMLGLDVKAVGGFISSEQQRELLYCTGVLPMPGPMPITVGVSSDLSGSATLASALFALDPTQVELSMIQDTMAELANMLAGQLKGSLNLSQNLGLPRVFTNEEFAEAMEGNLWRHIPVAAGSANLLLSFSTDAGIAGKYLG